MEEGKSKYGKVDSSGKDCTDKESMEFQEEDKYKPKVKMKLICRLKSEFNLIYFVCTTVPRDLENFQC